MELPWYTSRNIHRYTDHNRVLEHSVNTSHNNFPLYQVDSSGTLLWSDHIVLIGCYTSKEHNSLKVLLLV